jgi:hypothetical protein
MGRFATAAIITLALAGAAVESHAGDLPGAGPDNAAANGSAVPVERLLADVSAPPSPAPDVATAPDAQPMGGPMGWGGHPRMRPEAMWRMHHMMRTWGLFFNQPDKNLSDSDVQTLAQAVLLIHGNHSWKVIDVADAADGQATFAYATADGSVIARFSIDRHSGRITRIG